MEEKLRKGRKKWNGRPSHCQVTIDDPLLNLLQIFNTPPPPHPRGFGGIGGMLRYTVDFQSMQLDDLDGEDYDLDDYQVDDFDIDDLDCEDYDLDTTRSTTLTSTTQIARTMTQTTIELQDVIQMKRENLSAFL